MSFFQQPVAAAPLQKRSVAEAMMACLRESFAVLSSAGLATETELARTRHALEQAAAHGPPGDILETLARVQGAHPESLGAEVTLICNAVGRAVSPALPVIPFAAKLMAPTAFYGSFPNLQALAKMLMAPIIYAEDTDALGVGALNPIAAKIMAEEIVATVDERLGLKPFVSAVRMEYEGWGFLTRKQFSL
jgi:hypothetical protein